MSVKSLSPGLYKSARGQLIATLLEGSLAGKSFALGDTDFARNITVERSERYTNEYVVKTLAYSEVDMITCELNITAYQAGMVAQMVSHMSDARSVDEAPAAALIETLMNSRGDEIIPIPARRIGNVVVDAGISPLIEDLDYFVSSGDGQSFVSLMGTAAAKNAQIDVHYDRLASKGNRYDFGSQATVMVRLTYVENVRPAAGRSPETHIYYRVGLTVEGDHILIGSEASPRTIVMKGKVYPDMTKTPGRQLGYIEDNIMAS